MAKINSVKTKVSVSKVFRSTIEGDYIYGKKHDIGKRKNGFGYYENVIIMVLQLEGNSDLIKAFEILFVFVRPILHILSQRKIPSNISKMVIVI